MIYLELAHLIRIARRVIGETVAVRDYGLLQSALARRRYPDDQVKTESGRADSCITCTTPI